MLHLCFLCNHPYEMREFLMKGEEENAMDYDDNTYATGMYLFGNVIRIDTFTAPNVIDIMVDDQLIWKVLRPIKKGEQLIRPFTVLPFTAKEESVIMSRLAIIEESFPDLKHALKPAKMTIREFRKLSLVTIEDFEEKAIDFLQEYDFMHPSSPTHSLQKTWILIWNYLLTRFEFEPLKV